MITIVVNITLNNQMMSCANSSHSGSEVKVFNPDREMSTQFKELAVGGRGLDNRVLLEVWDHQWQVRVWVNPDEIPDTIGFTATYQKLTWASPELDQGFPRPLWAYPDLVDPGLKNKPWWSHSRAALLLVVLNSIILGVLRKTLQVSKYIIGDSLWNGLVNRFIIFASTPSSPAASRGADSHSRNTDFDGQSIRSFFRLETVRPHDKMRGGTAPTIILVCDAVFAFMVLGEAGVDTTNWELSATSLLAQTSARPMPCNAHRQDSLVAGSRRPADSRSRSRSTPMNQPRFFLVFSPSSISVSPYDPRLSLAKPGMPRPAPSLLEIAQIEFGFPCWIIIRLMYNVWKSLVGAAPIDDRVEVIRPGPLPSLGSTSDSVAYNINPVGKIQGNSEDEIMQLPQGRLPAPILSQLSIRIRTLLLKMGEGGRRSGRLSIMT
ncbi:hypothetical protein BS47DRAFT_1367587 [Hydnum rufescens UP504]|uniref:Uncharacterized protein n=1 Tax=Hydnum rufescens UP504 TaxID=1448309 RepID=A0A9P6AIU8_9AGAM|nr:hypothetical protein BS47DRAFT_1367587 [Hydnum rufescens UP504]